MVVGEFRLEWKALFEKRGVVRWCHTVDKMNRTWSRNRRVAVLTDTGLFLMKGRTMSRALPLSWISIVEADQVAPQLGFRVESEHGLVLDFLSYPRKKEFLAEIKDAYFAKMQAPIAVEVLSTNRPLRGYLNVSRKPRWDVNRGAAETLLLHRNSVFVFPRLDALKSPDAAPGESPDEEDRIDGLFLNGEDPRYADNSFNRSPVDPLPDAFPHPDALGSPSNANRSPRSSPARSPRPEPAVLSPLEYVGNSVRSLHSAQRTGLSPAAAGESPRFPVLLSPAAHAAAESPRGSVLHSPTHAALRSPHASFSPRHPPLGSPLRSVVRSPRHRSFEPEALSRHSSLPAADEGFEPRAAAGYVPSGVVSFRGDSVVLVQHPPDLVSAGNSPHLPPAAAGGRGAGVAAAAQQQQQQQHLVSVAANSHALRMKGASLMSPRRPVGPEPDGFAWAAPAGRGAAVHPGLRLQPQPAGRAGLGRGQPFYSSHERQPSAYSFQGVPSGSEAFERTMVPSRSETLNRPTVPRHGETIPYHEAMLPHYGNVAPHYESATPYRENLMPYDGHAAPENMFPRRGNAVPHQGNVLPYHQHMVPHPGNVAPHHGNVLITRPSFVEANQPKLPDTVVVV